MRDQWSRDGPDATPKRLQTTRYHEFQCQICGYTGNRHSTTAMVEAITMKHAIEGFPQCLPSYRIAFSLSTHLGRIWG